MRFYSLANRNFKEIYRDPVSILLGLVMPLAMLLLFTTIEKRVPLEIFSAQSLTPGIVVFSFTFTIMFVAMLLAKDKQSAFLVRLFTTPLKSSDYILSYILPFIPLTCLQVVICFITGTILGATFSNILLSFNVFFFVALTCINLGIILGSLFTVNQISGIGSILITAIGLFSNVWMDLKMVGGIFETIGYALPFAHAVDAVKGLSSGMNFSNIAGHFSIVLIYSLALFPPAILSFRRVMIKVRN
jgi:ABC-2 type transport system permease protein